MPYEYQPLESATHIRLLTLHFSPPGSPIQCSLEHASLHSAPHYEALSYTWGNPWQEHMTPKNVDIRGSHIILLEHTPVEVTYNLYAALRQLSSGLSKSGPGRRLWTDAISIDQANNEEKSEQVRMMSDIYRHAERVLSWLSEEDEYTRLAFQSLAEICWATKVLMWQEASIRLELPLSQISETGLDTLFEVDHTQNKTSRAWTLPLWDNKPREEALIKSACRLIHVDFASKKTPSELATLAFGHGSLANYIVSNTGPLSSYPSFSEVLQALDATFWSKSYWSRLWIVQECLSARDGAIICGGFEMDFLHLAILRVFLAREDLTGSSQIYANGDFESISAIDTDLRLITNISILRIKAELRPLAKNIHHFSAYECSDPRDIIYALLSLSAPFDLEVDYGKSVPEVFIEATTGIIKQQQNLLILCTNLTNLKVLSPITFQLPSWVPNYWSENRGSCFINPWSSLEKQTYRAGGTFSDKAMLHTSDFGLLPVEGYSFGTIKQVVERLDNLNGTKYGDIMSIATRILESVGLTAPKQVNDFWRTFLLDQYSDKQGYYQRTNVPGSFNSDLEAFLDPTENSHASRHFLKNLNYLTLHKTFCIGSEGNMAMVAGEVQEKDRIFVVRGAPCPLILRHVQTKEGTKHPSHYTFIGPAYVHGIMDGEFWTMATSDTSGMEETTVYLV